MRIQRVPSGLLDYLKLRSQGETPDNLLADVRGTVDLSPNYDLDRYEVESEPIGMVAGQIEFIEVPNDEVWKLIAVGVTKEQAASTVDAAWLFQFSIERLVGAGLNGVPFHTSPRIDVPRTISNLARPAYAFFMPTPLMMRAGQRLTVTLCFGTQTSGGTAGNDATWNGDFWAHIVRMKV